MDSVPRSERPMRRCLRWEGHSSRRRSGREAAQTQPSEVSCIASMCVRPSIGPPRRLSSRGSYVRA
eukprot:117478-Pleurochrysis_carterae.AAC.1